MFLSYPRSQCITENNKIYIHILIIFHTFLPFKIISAVSRDVKVEMRRQEELGLVRWEVVGRGHTTGWGALLFPGSAFKPCPAARVKPQPLLCTGSNDKYAGARLFDWDSLPRSLCWRILKQCKTTYTKESGGGGGGSLGFSKRIKSPSSFPSKHSLMP